MSMELEQIWEENKIKYECRQVTDEITEDDKVNYDFLIVMSKFLLYQDFSIVRKNVCRLVERGSKRALAFYFKFEEPKNWKKEYVEIAKNLAESDNEKTAEEWEIIANFRSHDPVCVFMHDDLKTVSDLKETLKTFLRRYVAHTKNKKQRFSEDELKSFLTNYAWLRSNFLRTDYADALMKAKIGYFLRFFQDVNILDALAYMQLSNAPDSIVDVTTKMHDLHPYDWCDYHLFFDTVGQIYENVKKSKEMDVSTYFTKAFAMTIDNTTTYRKFKQAYKMIELVAFMPFTEKEMENQPVDAEKIPEKPKEDEFPENTIFFG